MSHSIPASPPPEPINILIVEDSPDDAQLLVHELKNAGFAPAWKRVDTEPEYVAQLGPHLDVIFSDFSLPQFSTTLALKRLVETRLDVPFIIVSGTIGEERAVECLRSGAVDYVLKDRLNRLAPAVRRALRETRERRERKLAEATLRESEARFRQLAENITEVFWITDPAKQHMLYVSPAYATIWGRSCESLYQSPQDWLEAIHAEDRKRIQEAAARKQSLGQYEETYRIVRPDGSIRWIRDRAFPIHDKQGRVQRIVGVAEDITGHRELEQQLRQAQKMEAIGQLAGGVAHDFNNLLAVIQCNVDLVLMDADQIPSEVRESLSQIAQAADRAASLTRQLLAFSRKQVVELRPVKLNDAVANLTRMLNRIIGEHIRLQCRYASGLPLILADPGMLDQIVMNLVVNARDAMPRGGELTLSTTLANIDAAYEQAHPQAAAGQFVCLSISDTGCGIPKENLTHIFEPFFTTKETGRGTGLGLSTVYGIVQQHQGWITVDSELDRGSMFRVYFPALHPLPSASIENQALRPATGGTGTILLVEDEAPLRLLTAAALERFGYKVIEADSGLAALTLWRENHSRIDAIVTDLIMPGGINGHELVESLRKSHPDLPAVYTSGYNPGTLETGSEALKGAIFVQKPYSPNQLAEAVRQALRK